MTTFAFTRMTLADLPTLRDWLLRPHVREWWGDPDEEVASVRDMIEGRDTTEPYFFAIDGKTHGYIQAWYVADQINPEMLAGYPWLTLLPKEAVGVDLTIAEPDHLSRGIGSAVLTAFVRGLRQRGHATIIIDPDPANLRAVRAYEKAGFRIIPDLVGKTDDSLLMQHHLTH
jgi:RimJ/RimL family protein N-acetyltransferase